MTDYAAPKLTEMFVHVKPSPQRCELRALTLPWSRWRSPEIGGICIAHLARFSQMGDVAITPHHPICFDGLTV
ncbi:hypothetical protein FHY13_001145 [Xanthomonas arboricola]|uniref:hypothetical protein n=1 Tax=Xanthomonas euroxanthea TaxID=2259622 RepID=UPI0016099A36|nr:hypothetical protein [Xanthomonas euroxanthea]MBB3812839.1 hypothetical protein [Xanthomonas euroxanthea]